MTAASAGLAEAARKLAAEGVRLVQIELPEIDGGMRAKLISIKKAESGSGSAFCTIVYCLSTADDVYETPSGNYANGFPDWFAMPDPATLRRLPWLDDTAAAICDLYDADGRPVEVAPRGLLRRAADKAASMGYEARFAMEYELFVLHADPVLLKGGRQHGLQSLSRTWNAYSHLRLADTRPLLAEFTRRMEGIGIAIEACHTELGYGSIEIAIAHAPPLEAADRALRAKAYLKELCNERGLVATFMPKWDTKQSGSGGHIHQSLWRDGANQFIEDGAPSPLCKAYAAGQLATLADFTAIFLPSINAYRRPNGPAWAPENVSWGTDNRTAALRYIAKPSSAAARIEHRVSGADVNPYLAMAAQLAGGLHGIENRLVPPAPSEGNAAANDSLEHLPRDLAEATARLKGSALARALLGDAFVDHYAISREVEWRLWQRWLAETVTPWELDRYFQTI
ncbi:MAG: glutamine synthetase family protein [Alphaproteobacteria bacterium]